MRVLRAPDRPEPRMLRPDGRIIQAGGHRMRELDVAVLVLQHERAGSLEHHPAATGEPRGPSALAVSACVYSVRLYVSPRQRAPHATSTPHTFRARGSMSAAPVYTWHLSPSSAHAVAVATPC